MKKLTNEEFLERFWNKVDKNGSVPLIRPDLGPCWIWKGRLDKLGYGRLTVNRNSTVAYGVAYKICRGNVGDGLELDHLCRVHPCVNPNHLEAVTHIIFGGMECRH